MKKIGITGSLASGKTTACRLLSYKKGPFFSADSSVKQLYKKNLLKKILYKKFQIKKNLNLKKEMREKVLNSKSNLIRLEKILHPLVRKEMNKFINTNKNKKLLFFEIPLLIENNLMKKFDYIIFIKAKKSIRLKRFKKKGGSPKLFNLLNSKQLNDKKKIKFSDYTITNEKNLEYLKKKILHMSKKL